MNNNSHDFLAELLLEPGVNETDCNRGQMFTSHLAQCIQITDAEPPLIFTNFENQVGKYSTGFKELKGSYQLIKKIYKNKFNYAAIFKNIETNEYSLEFRNEVNWFTEHFGSRINNQVIDSLEEGDIISNKKIWKDQNYDEQDNLQIGKNLNAVYLAYKGYTNEDALVMSESAANALSSYFVKKLKIHVNTNDILINLYGDEENYIPFPRIGEEIKNGILLSRRRINYNKILNDLNNLNSSSIEDDNFYAKGILVDIDIYNNSDLSVMKNQKYNEEIYSIIQNNNDYYKRFVDFLNPIVESTKKNKYTDELLYYYNRYKSFLDINPKYSYQGNTFDNYIIIATILEKRPVVIGSKISGRYGNKSVVSLILPDDQMPTYEIFDGSSIRKDTAIKMRADIILSPQGVINRLNPSQLIEQEINYIGKVIRYRMEGLLKENKVKEALNLLLKFVKICNEKEEQFLSDFIKKLNKNSLKDFLKELVNNGIPIHQPPFWNNINIDTLEKLYDEFNIKDSKCKDISNSLIIGEEYFLRLKHEPKDKFSARSTSLNNLKDLPTKNRTHKEGKSLYSKTPVRIGEMETTNLNLSNNMRIVKKLLDSYANNKNDREILINESLLGNPFDINFESSGTKSNNSTIIDVLLYSMGLELKKEDDDE